MSDRFEAALDYLVTLANKGVDPKDRGKVREAATDVRREYEFWWMKPSE